MQPCLLIFDLLKIYRVPCQKIKTVESLTVKSHCASLPFLEPHRIASHRLPLAPGHTTSSSVPSLTKNQNPPEWLPSTSHPHPLSALKLDPNLFTSFFFFFSFILLQQPPIPSLTCLSFVSLSILWALLLPFSVCHTRQGSLYTHHLTLHLSTRSTFCPFPTLHSTSSLFYFPPSWTCPSGREKLHRLQQITGSLWPKSSLCRNGW